MKSKYICAVLIFILFWQEIGFPIEAHALFRMNERLQKLLDKSQYTIKDGKLVKKPIIDMTEESEQIIDANDWQRVYLASFPRSGNHWVRFLIEEATHVATSSVYPDSSHTGSQINMLFPWKGYCSTNGYFGSCRYPNLGEIVVVKTHYPFIVCERDKLPYVKTIYLIRNPIDAIHSVYLYYMPGNMNVNSDIQNIPSDKFKIPMEHVKYYTQIWRQSEEYWSTKKNVLIVRYEDLLMEPYLNLENMLEFIGYKIEQEDILRAVSKFPAQGEELRHQSYFSKEGLDYIIKNVGDLLLKYRYTVPMHSEL